MSASRSSIRAAARLLAAATIAGILAACSAPTAPIAPEAPAGVRAEPMNVAPAADTQTDSTSTDRSGFGVGHG